MRKKEFLEELERYLIGISREEKDDILQDYEEHFKAGKKNKRTESEIIKSLGDPREIARETRRELTKSKKPELKAEAVETWVATKQFTTHLWVSARDKIGDVVQKDKKNKSNTLPNFILGGLILLALIILFDHWFFWLVTFLIVGYLFYDYYKNKPVGKSATKTPEKTNTPRGETSAGRLACSLIFNLLFFIWFWLGIGIAIFGLFVAGVALMIAGIAVITVTGFVFVVHGTALINDLLLAGFFAGIGILIFGGLFNTLTMWIAKIYFKITQAYIKLNGRFIRKWAK